MANESTKYTHRIEKSSQLLKALTYVTLERYTGDTLSRAYWRIKEGKGLLRYDDKKFLDAWSSLITKVRRFCSSPLPLSTDQFESIKEERDYALEQMEAWRDWISLGCYPIYLYEYANYDGINEFSHSIISLQFAINALYPDIVNADIEDQKQFWREIDMDHLVCEGRKVYEKLKPLFEKADLEKDFDFFAEAFELYGYKTLPYDKVWQIRTDMDHRSSKDAGINSTLNWMVYLPTKLDQDDSYEWRALEYCESIMNDLIEWKKEIKERKNKGEVFTQEDKDDAYNRLWNAIQNFQIPSSPRKRKEGA